MRKVEQGKFYALKGREFLGEALVTWIFENRKPKTVCFVAKKRNTGRYSSFLQRLSDFKKSVKK